MESNKTLYQLEEEIQQFERCLDALEGDVTDETIEEFVNAWFTDIESSLESKLDGYGKLIKNREALAAGRKVEADRLNGLVKTDTTLVKKLKDRIRDFFNRNKKKKIETDLFKFWVQDNSQRSISYNVAVYNFSPELGDLLGDSRKSLPNRYLKTVQMVDSDQLKADLNTYDAWKDRDDLTEAETVVLADLKKYFGGETCVAKYEPKGNHLRIK